MKNDNFQAWLKSSYLSGGNASYIEELYESYLKDPQSVNSEWRDYFQSLPKISGLPDVSHEKIRNYFVNLVKQPKIAVNISTDVLHAEKQAKVAKLINAYRTWGNLAAKLDPLGSTPSSLPQLELSHYGLSDTDLSNYFSAPDLMGTPTSTLRDILNKLQTVYCGTMTVEYMYISNEEEVRWIQQKVERERSNFSADEKKRILQQLIAADGLEKYLSTKYVGQKRFSLEGGDALIPMLEKMIHRSSDLDVEGIVMCMAHRGRLNVLLNIAGQAPQEIFDMFEGKKDYKNYSGDVKYHNGISSDIKTSKGSIHLYLEPNPSHLEIISPVAMGAVRARQDRHNDASRSKVMTLMIHGDASFSGQGVVMEMLNMSLTKANFVGGSLHLVINNQVGFTTDSEDSRSSFYCTDVAKMIEAPVFHVNGDDPEAAVFLSQLMIEYRMKFKKDIVIDLVCYRRLGHNEADEPAATQPLMYSVIRQHPTPAAVYAQKLIAENVVTQKEVDAMIEQYRDTLDKGQRTVELVENAKRNERAANWQKYIGQKWDLKVKTAISRDQLQEIAQGLKKLPKGFEMQRQVGLMMTARNKMLEGETPLNWGTAESMAFASLLLEKFPIRISGQDSERGTFAHRHAVLHDINTGETYIPLQNLSKNQANFQVYDSILSEEAVVAFEYGYGATDPQTLVVWEAQYGDFANGAQVVVDQFLSSGEQKWQQLSGLAMFLPHGYEGDGPEHSSARLERYLQLCAQDNMQVCVPSTPAQAFHMIRRQMLRPYRTPLIVMTPKSLLRHKLCISTLDDLTSGEFQLVIPEVENLKKVRKVILCSGKVYYDLLAQRQERKINDVALIRIEQLYPFPADEVKKILEKYKNTQEIIWCQEEPKNQGAWLIIRDWIAMCLSKDQALSYVARKSSASPSAGYGALHKKEQAALLEEALG